MATITSRPGGQKIVQFKVRDNKRKTISLGKVPDRTAERFRDLVDDLVAYAVTGQTPPRELIKRASKLSDALQAKLETHGLIPKRSSNLLGEFLDEYIASRTDVKGSTLRDYGVAKMNLLEYFGKDRELRAISPGDADEFVIWLEGKYARATAGRRTNRAKRFFNAALRKRLLDHNPFADVKSNAQANRDRDYFVTRDKITKVLEACPDAEWRTIFALSRFGGLRIPSELVALKWADVDWATGRLHVTSPKTEHHVGKESRVIPLFPELRTHLEHLWEMAEPGDEYVCKRYRSAGKNLRTQAQRVIKRAGLTPWPKTFQNMRASRETELAKEHPLHVVTAWIGNSTLIAAKHYLQVTDAVFEQAMSAANALQQRAEMGGNGAKSENQETKKPAKTPVISTHAGFSRGIQLPEPNPLTKSRAALSS